MSEQTNCTEACPKCLGTGFLLDQRCNACAQPLGPGPNDPHRPEICLPHGVMFDYLGNQRRRFIRVIFDGMSCVVRSDAEANEYRLNDPEGVYEFKDVYLSQEEFDALPEFDGF